MARMAIVNMRNGSVAANKSNICRQIPFSKQNQPIDDTWRDIIDFFEDPAHGEWLAFHLIVPCEMRLTGPVVGNLIRQLLRAYLIASIVWSNDARNQPEPVVPEVLQAFIESTIDAMTGGGYQTV